MSAIRASEMACIWQSSAAKKPRQEICAPLKWFCFFLNFTIFLIGVTCLALGIYLCAKDPRPITEWEDICFNPAYIIILIGLGICVVSLCGLFGALRDNVLLLKIFAFCIFCAYVILVIGTFALFMLFYADVGGVGGGSLAETAGISAHSILLYTLRKYHTNRNVADFVDYIQEQLECCGTSSSSQGFRDWQLNEQFQCNQSNPYPERCGVPFSCCRKSVIGAAPTAKVTDGDDANKEGNVMPSDANPLFPAMRSLQCWQNAQTKRQSDLDADIYTRGCLQPLRALFERHAMHLGAIVAAIILPVCFGVCLTQCLAHQIDYQRYLLDREARRHERRKRRELRYTEQQSKCKRQQQINNKNNVNGNNIDNSNNISRMEKGLPSGVARKVSASTQLKSPPPNFPPPPTPRDEPDAAELAAALAASRQQWYEDEKRRRQTRQRRAISTSPMRQHATSITVPGGGSGNGGRTTQTLEQRRSDRERAARDIVTSRRRASAQLSASAAANAILNGGSAIVSSAPPLPSYASQQYLLKQSDFI